MDNKTWISRLHEGADALGIVISEGQAGLLKTFADELLRWNAHINLTGITAPEEILEKHLLDAVAVLPDVTTATTLLDVGAGAGIPGVPLAIMAPSLHVQLVDAVSKKVSFIKSVAATLGLSDRVRARHATLAGEPQREGVERADRVICRAVMELPAWLDLARPYVKDGGQVLAMVATAQDPDSVARAHGYRLMSERSFELPFSGARRAVLAFELQPGST